LFARLILGLFFAVATFAQGPGLPWPGSNSSTAAATHTFTFVQHKQSAFNCSVSASCTLSGLSTLGSGHAMFLGVYYGNSTPLTISSVTGGGTWVLNAGTTACQFSGVSMATAYNLSSTSGGTTIAVTLSAAPTSAMVIFFEEDSYSPSDGGASLDSATSVKTSTAASPLPGAVPTITGSSDAVWQFVTSAGSNPTAINASYANTLFQSGFGMADLLNTTSTTQPGWTVSGNSQGCAAQISLK
jgi:hypothetical protein